jgi:hypothetical protein
VAGDESVEADQPQHAKDGSSSAGDAHPSVSVTRPRSPIPADDLDAGTLRQPLGQAGRLPVGQQINRPSGLDIDQNRSVGRDNDFRALADCARSLNVSRTTG